MTTASKCLVVFALATSLAFLGFAAAVLQGGPNYQSQLKDPMLNGYVFETSKKNKKTGKTTYSVKTRRFNQDAEGNLYVFDKAEDGKITYTGKTHYPKQDEEGKWEEEVIEKDSPVLAKVIIAARNHLESQQEVLLQGHMYEDEDEVDRQKKNPDLPEIIRRKIPGLQEIINRIRRKTELAIKEINEDKAAFQKRELMLVADLKRVQDEIDEKSVDANKETADARRLQKKATKRREDVYRLKNQLEELETDLYRAGKQREQLEDLLFRLQSKVQRLQRRNKQLKY